MSITNTGDINGYFALPLTYPWPSPQTTKFEKHKQWGVAWHSRNNKGTRRTLSLQFALFFTFKLASHLSEKTKKRKRPPPSSFFLISLYKASTTEQKGHLLPSFVILLITLSLTLSLSLSLSL